MIIRKQKIIKCLRVIHSFKDGNETEIEQIDSTEIEENFMAEMYGDEKNRKELKIIQ